MKKLLTLVLAVLLIAGLLPMAVMAEAPAEVKVKIYNGTAADFTLTLADGAEVYLVAGEEGKDLIKWTEAEAPTDKFVSFAYAADTGVLKTTFKNLVTDQFDAGGYTCHGIWYQSGDYKVDIELIGENSMTHGKSACIKNENSGGMTISGSGSMTMNIGTAEKVGSASGALWTNGGDLLIKNTTMNFKVIASESAKHHSILAGKGNVTIEGSKITTDTLGGQLVYTGLSTDKNVRYVLDPNPERFVKVKDSEITATANKTIFESTNPVTIQNSTVKITLKSSGGPAFSPAPTFEGDYTAIAGLKKNAEKLDKLKYYQQNKLGSYTYIYIVPGIQDLLPTETEPEVTVPDVTDPDPIVPDVTEPDPIVPDVTTPDASTPDASTPDASTPSASTPSESKPTTNTPSASNPAGNNSTDKTDDATKADAANKKDDENGKGSPLKVVLIIMIVLVVAAGGAFGVILYLKKKKAQ